MVRAVPQRRFFWMILLLVIAFAGLGYRLVDLQFFQHGDMRPEADSRTQRTIYRVAQRGNILDCRQNLLATSELVKTVCANPSLTGSNHAFVPIIARALAPLLQTNEAWLEQRLQFSTFTNEHGRIAPRQYAVLKRKVSLEDWEKIQTTLANLKFVPSENKLPRSERVFHAQVRRAGIFADAVDDQLRTYPHGPLAAHVLGFVGTEERRTNDQTYVETFGASGMEAVMNQVLTGVPGWRKTEMVRSRELANFRDHDVEPRNGHNVVLTIDAGLQHILETELADAFDLYHPISASGVIVRPRTGEILALANLPTFDPNKPGASPPDSWRIRAITDNYEPGSTFKIVAISAALNENLASLDTSIDCENGYWVFAGRRLKDDHPIGVAPIWDVVAKSSNIGTAKLAIQLGQDRLYQYIRDFGFGVRTGVPLPGEENGILWPTKKWSKLSISRIPIGQGVAVTPLQMVMATAAIANGGRLMQPMLVKKVIDDQGHAVAQNEPRVVRQVVQESAARQMIAALKRVVSTNGTAPRAVLEHFTVAGKTGTAEKPGPLGYVYNKYYASFMGFLPADNPEVCIGIMLDDPKPLYYGGRTAGPTFKNIAERSAKYLALKPDLLPADTQVAVTVPERTNTAQTAHTQF